MLVSITRPTDLDLITICKIPEFKKRDVERTIRYRINSHYDTDIASNRPKDYKDSQYIDYEL